MCLLFDMSGQTNTLLSLTKHGTFVVHIGAQYGHVHKFAAEPVGIAELHFCSLVTQSLLAPDT